MAGSTPQEGAAVLPTGYLAPLDLAEVLGQKPVGDLEGRESWQPATQRGHRSAGADRPSRAKHRIPRSVAGSI